LVPGIKISEINQLAPQWITKENRSVILTAPAKQGLQLPTEEYLQQLLDEAEKLNPEPYKDKFLDMPILSKDPVAGKVSSERKITEKDINVTEWTLSNGVKVIIKPTDYQNDQIMYQ